ncbi:double-stranded RNA-binding protein Staufen homolog [Zeugodacus cucurbitae]|nr:double-stranded RNA-binding protein Staufen homolog [Zeugodacus cucurbitae]
MCDTFEVHNNPHNRSTINNQPSTNMRGFIALYAFVALSAAAPQQGYQYAAQTSGGQLTHTVPQPHVQYGVVPPKTADFLKDLQTVMAVQSANLAPNFELNTQPQLVSFSKEQYAAVNGAAGAAASAQVSVAQPQARYLAPTLVGGNSLEQQPQQLIQQQFAQQHQVPQQLQFQQQPLQSQQHFQQQATQQITLPEQPLHQQSTHFIQQQSQRVEPETVISKRFYLHAAPEDDDEEVKQHHVTVGKPRKNYNVVFIKSSDKSTPKTSLKITPAVNEEKTVIYVLNKKQDAADIDTQVYEPVTTTAKPEVYFIKYKTAEEAAHAQQTIQAQYDALGGSTQVTNEGVAPVSSVIGSLDAAKQAEAEAAAAAEAVQSAPNIQADEQQQAAQIPVVPAVGAQSASVQPEEQLQVVEQSLSQGSNTNNGYLPPSRYYFL